MIERLRSQEQMICEASLLVPPAPPIAVEASANLVDLGGRPTVLLIARDRREKREAERRQTLLMAELQHRVKNILATVHSLVMQTVQTSASLDSFAASIDGRLKALAATQDLMLRSDVEGLDLREVLLEELAPYIAEGSSRVSVSGPRVLLTSGAAQTLGMVFHELATNASKYGALGAPEGRLEVAWAVEETAAGARLSLRWIESGVGIAEAAAPKRGFGSALIEKALPFEFGGTARMELTPGGLHCLLEIPCTGKLGTFPELGAGAKE